jgi:sugar lactone lactonase YvrE
MAPPQQIRSSTPRAVYDTRYKLGESPIWDEDNQRLLWVDQERLRIHWLYPADGRQGSVPTRELTPAIILTQQSPDILVVPMEQVTVLDPDVCVWPGRQP